MQREQMMRPIAGPWYERADIVHVHRIPDVLLDEWVRIGRVETRCVNGRYAYRKSSLAGKIRLLHAAETAPKDLVTRNDAQTKGMEALTPPYMAHALPLSAGASHGEISGELPAEACARLLVTLGVLAGSVSESAPTQEDIDALLNNLQRLASGILRPHVIIL